MPRTFQYTETLQVLECADCGVTFAITGTYMSERRKDHKNFYCPSGHTNYYSQETEEEKLRKQLDKTERDRDWWKTNAQAESKRADHEEMRARGYKGNMVKIKHRVAKGICPACHRSFPQLTEHMRTEHPGFTSDDAS
jgi:hypothetical protein